MGKGSDVILCPHHYIYIYRLYILHTAYQFMSHVYILILQIRGFAGFYRGIQARVIFQVPATAISWSVYETFKNLLTNNEGDNYHNLGVLPTVSVERGMRDLRGDCTRNIQNT